ncbi:DM13 domain-containing protein [Catellatospora sp. KI3]|uniref:DM13 domain-containing protein n=1 Tax=Catellatospora sp. KI3 TaxID=3041620 RepID=UPI0024825564|nr:DM13 domain-containing protein [Catellatospora sp. KI3]MDI1464405.1 DM13 domain-containing protein [Catellatospora sp. KI3]
MGRLKQLLRNPLYQVGAGVVVLALALGLYFVGPSKLFDPGTWNDGATEAAADGGPGGAAASPAPGQVPAQDPHKTVAVVVAQGELVSQEQAGKGVVEVVWLPDGRYQVILRDLVTSGGSDLRVWLSDQAVRPGKDGARVFADGKHVELGKLKGTSGTQVYEVPSGVDPKTFRSVAIWSQGSAFSLAAAPLQA